MKSSKDKWHFDKIIDYFEDKLTDEEQEAIDSLIAEDADFAEWIDILYADWQEDPAHYRKKVYQFRQDFFDQLEPAGESSARVPSATMRRKRRRMITWALSAAAAAIAILLLIVIPKQPPELISCALDDHQCIIEETGGNYPEKFIRGGSSSTEKQVIAVANAYKEERYGAVIEQVPPLLDDSLAVTYQPALRLYLGIAQLSAGRPEATIPTLLPLAEEETEESLVASWYLALAYLALEEQLTARIFLEKVSATNNLYQASAEKLLRRIPSE